MSVAKYCLQVMSDDISVAYPKLLKYLCQRCVLSVVEPNYKEKKTCLRIDILFENAESIVH